MATQYRYFGILKGDATPDRPSGVIRVWTGSDGQQMEETFTYRLTWEPSHEFSSNTGPITMKSWRSTNPRSGRSSSA